MQQNVKKYIVSFSLGYNNWYVSNFYKYFYEELIKKYGDIFEYIPIEQFGKEKELFISNQNTSIFNWYNLIIYNKKSEKYFVHSWNDYAPEMFIFGLKNQLNIVKFSCVSNLNDSLLEKYPDQLQPSVYLLENWNDLKFIQSTTKSNKRLNKAYFNGLPHGLRENYFKALNSNDFFHIFNKTVREERRTKQDYYTDLSNYKYCLSFQGQADICYRDLEIFGLGSLNLRNKFTCNLYNPLVEGEHYISFFTPEIEQKILKNEDINNDLNLRIEEVLDNLSEKEYNKITENSLNWFNENCVPFKQFNIIESFLNELTLLDE